ncbi:ribosomal protein 20 [Ophiostoma piceae UAMH 11346]|uniref:Ribosomal protein 20 n=1 Tax=Ophiostoma piceae (strain UAMH 11346) TaxID=1262450 RepID=S3C168_OPHP1|nr:ribosomal protein 20 [Ophiostoma piceae UAMH 11346]
MDARLLRRVACPATGLQTSASASSSSLISRLIPTSLSASAPAVSSAAVLPASRRYQSTRNRTKRALNIAPHASFAVPGSANAFRPNKHATGSASSEGATASVLGTVSSPLSAGAAATILYNPPASAPSVYQTPFKFLPKSDPRRVLNISSMFKAIDAAPATASAGASAPEVNRHFKPTEKYHLSEEDVAEMRRLRAEDPKQWSVLALAKKYQCSAVFVMLATKGKAGEAHTAASKARLDAVKERWGPIRTKARVERTKRRELLYNGEI